MNAGRTERPTGKKFTPGGSAVHGRFTRRVMLGRPGRPHGSGVEQRHRGGVRLGASGSTPAVAEAEFDSPRRITYPRTRADRVYRAVARGAGYSRPAPPVPDRPLPAAALDHRVPGGRLALLHQHGLGARPERRLRHRRGPVLDGGAGADRAGGRGALLDHGGAVHQRVRPPPAAAGADVADRPAGRHPEPDLRAVGRVLDAGPHRVAPPLAVRAPRLHPHLPRLQRQPVSRRRSWPAWSWR